MKKFKLPVYWTMSGTIEVEAETVQEAIDYAYSDKCRLPDECYYLEDSFEVEESEIEVV